MPDADHMSQDMKVRTFLIGFFVACGVGLSPIGAAAAEPTAPAAGYNIDPEYTKTSTDGAIAIEGEASEIVARVGRGVRLYAQPRDVVHGRDDRQRRFERHRARGAM